MKLPPAVCLFASLLAAQAPIRVDVSLVMDVSGSQQSFIKPHHKDLQAFLKTVLGKQDKAFLVAFGNRIMLVCDYSNSAKELVNALGDFEHDNRNRRADYPMVGSP